MMRFLNGPKSPAFFGFRSPPNAKATGPQRESKRSGGDPGRARSKALVLSWPASCRLRCPEIRKSTFAGDCPATFDLTVPYRHQTQSLPLLFCSRKTILHPWPCPGPQPRLIFQATAGKSVTCGRLPLSMVHASRGGLKPRSPNHLKFQNRQFSQACRWATICRPPGRME